MSEPVTPTPQVSPPSRESVVRFDNVHKGFDELKVLQGLDLEVAAGECVVVMGPSGTGKSVLLKHIIGLLHPDAGEVHTLGVNVNNAHAQDLEDLRKKVGYVFQLSALFDSMSVGENVALGLTMHSGRSRPEIAEKVKECLALVDLEGIESRPPADLSGGMKKRVAIARAIATDPTILLYDEPTTGLDPATCKVVNRLIRDLNDRLKVTSIVVTHDVQSATSVADRISLYNHGKVVSQGSPDEFSKDGILHRFVQGEKI